MSNKTKVAKPTLSPSQQALTDEINKSNAKRGFTNNVVDMTKIKPKAKTRGNASGAGRTTASDGSVWPGPGLSRFPTAGCLPIRTARFLAVSHNGHTV